MPRFIMKLNKLETHDRLLQFSKQDSDISECCQDIINQKPFGSHPFYIFAHTRTIGMDERFKLFSSGSYATFEEVPEKTIIWQPRLTKPKAESNSMLFKAYPGTDKIKIIWMIPATELWGQYRKGLMTENKIITDSIFAFENDKKKLEAKESDDLEDYKIDNIYRQIAIDAKSKKLGLIL